jgi:2-amino-4-hydroxy-6-hydroxymethyldihydropteridine diphosphokinase
MGRVIDPARGAGRATATTVAVALGSNVGDRLAHLEFAVDRLRAHLAGVTVSPFIETEPVGVGPQGPFLNGALVGQYVGTPRDLLDTLLGIEGDRGRVRPYAGAPRTLDLDLILFGAAVLDEPGLTVPHPRFRDRRFVLEPLAAIAPGLVDPVSGRTIAQLLGALAGSA